MADREHATHYDDCGCKSARYEAALADLRARLAALEPVARAAVRVLPACEWSACAGVENEVRVCPACSGVCPEYAVDAEFYTERYPESAWTTGHDNDCPLRAGMAAVDALPEVLRKELGG